ncbi:permease [Sulfodiicoccus acidiphilus]|uniref:Permease n=1 Tax=Sulfodiicoccus acidiphilus TaxID=1670455 RepID=A0A348B3K9_9CREN|nr:ABC transporter permease [Sulfodiicoccus acidiphilus]BBD72761.1 permease [Sulfodiicoccus acidiphilus]GGT99605.1 permease [Sulfodiicoccus acidiphilus]
MTWLGLRGLTSRKMVAALAILSVAIGVTSVVSLVAYTTGVSDSIISAIETLGPTTILVLPSHGSLLTQATVTRLETLPYVKVVYPVVEGGATVSLGGQQTFVSVVGVDNLSTVLGQVNLQSGNVYPAAMAPLAVIGADVANPGNGIRLQPGDQLILHLQDGAATVEITGILQPSGFSPISDSDTSVFLPLQEAMVILNRTTYSIVALKVDSVKDVPIVSNLITYLFGNSVTVASVQQIINTVSTIVSGLSFLLTAVASISLLVGAIGIASTMITKVYQRIREIGIMKTVGMKNRDVLGVFLMESLIVGASGGALGVVLGTFGSIALAALLSGGARAGRSASGGLVSGHITPVVTPELLVGAVAIGLVVSLVAGIYPAWRASRLTPVEAIRRE